MRSNLQTRRRPVSPHAVSPPPSDRATTPPTPPTASRSGGLGSGNIMSSYNLCLMILTYAAGNALFTIPSYDIDASIGHLSHGYSHYDPGSSLDGLASMHHMKDADDEDEDDAKHQQQQRRANAGAVDDIDDMNAVDGVVGSADPAGPSPATPAAGDEEYDVAMDADQAFDDDDGVVDSDTFVMEIESDAGDVHQDRESDFDPVDDAAAASSGPAHVVTVSGAEETTAVAAASLSRLPATVFESVLEFLTVPEINVFRSVAEKQVMAAGFAMVRTVPQPFGPGVTFVRCSVFADLQAPRPTPRAPPKAFAWRCVNCASISHHHESCTHCGTSIMSSGCRVFMGQVRKQHTAVALRAVINSICPWVSVLHIESHSNLQGFEKGAAWVYVDSPADAHTLIDLNKRVLFDVDNDGHEGFWFIDGAADADKAQLAGFAATRKDDVQRRERPLPGNPLVAEFPSKSALRLGRPPQPLHLAAATTVTSRNRTANGWYGA